MKSKIYWVIMGFTLALVSCNDVTIPVQAAQPRQIYNPWLGTSQWYMDRATTLNIDIYNLETASVRQVIYSRDGVATSPTLTAAPYRYTEAYRYSDQNGNHRYLATVYFNDGHTETTGEITVQAANLSETRPSTTTPSLVLSASSNTVTTAGAFTLSALANNLTASKVEFYSGTTLINTDTVAPYSYTLNLGSANNGNKSFSAKAYPSVGAVVTSNTLPVTVNIPASDTSKPTVSLSSSSNNVTSAGVVTLTAGASDNVGVSKVEFYSGTTLIYTDTVAPYSYALNLSSANNGSYTYTSKAYDAAGNVATSGAVGVTVNIAATPSLVLSASSNTVTTAGAFTLSALANNLTASKVEFYSGTTLINTDTTAPYSYTLNLGSANNGNKSFSAKAYPSVGAVVTSNTLPVTVNIPASDTSKPTVSLSSSSNNVTSAGVVTLTAGASDNVGVSKVEFYSGTTLIYTDTVAPYSYTLNLSSANNGSYTYTSKAYDAAGNVATSGAVGVTVNIAATSGWTASAGTIYHNGVEVPMYGINWFGLETSDRALHGLWTGRSLASFMNQIKTLGFTALRLPVSPQTINAGFSAASWAGAGDGRAQLEKTLQAAQAAGLYVLLDFHTYDPALIGGGLPGTPFGGSYTKTNWLNDLSTMAALANTYPNVFAIDIVNEPYNLSWSGMQSLAGEAGTAILQTNPQLLVFVEGVGNASNTGGYSAFWGGNLTDAANIAGIPASKLVYAPHAYGPDVSGQSYFTASNFPNNMPDIWNTHFGHLVAKGYTLAIGEFGGKYLNQDKVWQDAFVAYLKSKPIKTFFYWSFNPNSGDTGGILLDDWNTVNSGKMSLLKTIMP